jgi:hypothetical protein
MAADIEFIQALQREFNGAQEDFWRQVERNKVLHEPGLGVSEAWARLTAILCAVLLGWVLLWR